MNDYRFKTRELGISDEGIHFIRNGFNYKTCKYSDIKSVDIGRGKEVKNWILLLVLGIVLILIAVWWVSFWSDSILNIANGGRAKAIWGIVALPLFTFALGCYCVYSSIKNATVLTVNMIDSKTDFVSLGDIEKDGKLEDLREFLKIQQRSR